MRFNNRSLCNVLALFAAVKIQTCSPSFILNKLRAFGRTIGRLMLEAGIEDVASINPNVLLFQVWRGGNWLGVNPAPQTQLFFSCAWNPNTPPEKSGAPDGAPMGKKRTSFFQAAPH